MPQIKIKPGTILPEKPVTVDASINRWLQLQAIGKKQRTLDYHREIAGIIRFNWPDLNMPIDQVTDEQCVQFAAAIARYSSTRYNGVVDAIRKIIPNSRCIPRRRYVAPEKHIPTTDEFKRLLIALDQTQNSHAALVVRFLAHSGLRINEARQLQWSHLRDDHIYLPADITKNGHPRCVPFVDGMPDTIQALKRVRLKNSKRKEFVLPQCECKRALQYACKLAGIPRISHHTLRHYFTTQCIKSGVDIPTAAKWLGHLDKGALLLRWYCHLIDEHSLQMAARVKVGGVPQSVAWLNCSAYSATDHAPSH